MRKIREHVLYDKCTSVENVHCEVLCLAVCWLRKHCVLFVARCFMPSLSEQKKFDILIL